MKTIERRLFPSLFFLCTFVTQRPWDEPKLLLGNHLRDFLLSTSPIGCVCGSTYLAFKRSWFSSFLLCQDNIVVVRFFSLYLFHSLYIVPNPGPILSICAVELNCCWTYLCLDTTFHINCILLYLSNANGERPLLPAYVRFLLVVFIVVVPYSI